MRAFMGSVLATMLVLGSAGVQAADTYEVDASHTEVAFSVQHMMLSKVKGNFNSFQGTIVYDPEDMSSWSVEGSIDVASIDTDNEKRDEHLRSPDFFDAEKFPEITFKSKSFRKEGEETICVGDLTIRGVTREVEIPFEVTGVVKDPWGQTRVGGEAELEINRKDYGISWHKTLDTGGLVVDDRVEIELSGEAVLKK